MALRQAMARVPRLMNTQAHIRRSGDAAEAKKQKILWTKISYGMVGASGLLMVYTVAQLMTEEHHVYVSCMPALRCWVVCGVCCGSTIRASFFTVQSCAVPAQDVRK